MWEVMMWPVVACVLLPGLLVYLGLHVVRRGIIFIDIAMAQMASLGVCFAVMKHMDPDSPLTTTTRMITRHPMEVFGLCGSLLAVTVQVRRQSQERAR